MFALIYIPHFSLQAALRLEPELDHQAVALADSTGGKPIIVSVNDIAAQHGVLPDQTPIQAVARCDSLVIKNRSASLELSATEILLQTAYAFSPSIESTAPGVCTMELAGLGLQSEASAKAWAEKIIKTFAEFRLDCRIGFAPTPALALLGARSARPVNVFFEPDQFIPSLPIEALEPPVEIFEILALWGIRTAGRFLALGREAIAERLGVPGLELFDRLSPATVRPLNLVVPVTEFVERMDFEHEIETAEPLLFVLRRFTEQLAKRIGATQRVVGEMELKLALSNGGAYRHDFKIPQPTGRIETLFRTIQTHLETVRTDSPIVAVELRAAPAEIETTQLGFFEVTLKNPNLFGETLARLTALCGNDRVGTPVLLSTHRPDAFKMVAPHFSTARPAGSTPDALPGPRLRRLRPPAPANIQFADERPVSIQNSIFNGAIHSARGPFLSSGDWWDNNRWSRREWDVETSDGSLLRIFQSGDGCFVEGVYD